MKKFNFCISFLVLIPALVFISCESFDNPVQESKKTPLLILENIYERQIKGKTLEQIIQKCEKEKKTKLTEKDIKLITNLFNVIYEINQKLLSTPTKKGETFFECDFLLTYSPENVKGLNFSSVDSALLFLNKTLPLKVKNASLNQISKLKDEWIGDEIYTGNLTDYKQIITALGQPAAFGGMNSQFWYANKKQINFMENFYSWSNLGFTASISEKEHSENGSRVIWGKGLLKCGFGFNIGDFDFSIGEVTTTLSNSFVIQNY